MDNERVVQSIQVNSKETISLYSSYFEVKSRKRIFKRKQNYKYFEIESISLRISDEKEYVQSLGRFGILNIKIKKRGVLGFEFYETNLKELQHHTSIVVAFVGSMKACIAALEELGDNNFERPIIEIIEPEVLERKVSYQEILDSGAEKLLLEETNNKKKQDQKLLK